MDLRTPLEAHLLSQPRARTCQLVMAMGWNHALWVEHIDQVADVLTRAMTRDVDVLVDPHAKFPQLVLHSRPIGEYWAPQE